MTQEEINKKAHEEKILDKIRKLKNLAENNDNQAQSEAAMAMAYRLMVENKIEQAAVTETKPITEYFKHKADSFGKRPAEWQFIRPILIKFFGVNTVLVDIGRNKAEIHFVGTKENIEIAQYMYDMLRIKYRSLWDFYRNRTRCNLRYKKSYYMGLMQALYARLDSEKNAIEQEYGLILLPDSKLPEATQELFGPTKAIAHAGVVMNREVTNHGNADAENIQLSQGITQGQQNKRHLLS